MSKQQWQEALAWATADGTAVANTTAETILMPNLTLPGNYFQDGRLARVTFYGKLSTTGTPTMIFTLRWGGVAGTVINKTGAVTMGSGLANAPFKYECLIQTRSNGSAGTVFSMGETFFWDDAVGSTGSATNAPGIGAATQAGAAAPTTSTLDLTADTSLSITGTWSAASASNTITGHIYTIESLN